MFYRHDELMTRDGFSWAVFCLAMGFGIICQITDPGVSRAAFTISAIVCVDPVFRRIGEWFRCRFPNGL
jgi:hypothetical protein